ncbi:MAG: methylated-DNA--[protein]-cysteine S-methyltransferase [Planctomycetes bacterium]|nr:methylated-DNA--[protein]-cysteine S-methyltransferase [Planctomycetota bacterium]
MPTPTPRRPRSRQLPGRGLGQEDRRYHLFDTPLGQAALLWSPRGVCGALLPGEASPAAVAERWPAAAAAAPTPAVRALARRMVAHLRGRPDALLDVPLDLEGASAFDRAVWAAAREVPPGQVVTYGQLAARVGRPGAARAVGGAMGRNRVPFVVPCHRVVAAGGLGGFSSVRGLTTKRALLAAEGYAGVSNRQGSLARSR